MKGGRLLVGFITLACPLNGTTLGQPVPLPPTHLLEVLPRIQPRDTPSHRGEDFTIPCICLALVRSVARSTARAPSIFKTSCDAFRRRIFRCDRTNESRIQRLCPESSQEIFSLTAFTERPREH